MFSSTKQKLILGLYIFLILSIPIGAYLMSQRQTTKSQASEKVDRNVSLKKTSSTTSTPSAQKKIIIPTPTATPSPTPAIASTFGPTLNFKLILEGRPTNRQGGKVFIGIAEGAPAVKPKYLVSFTVDLPDSGIFDGLSLAGLNSGTQYSAYIKPTVQIATSSAFIMSPSITKLNNDQPIKLLTGDLNEDNTINSADYAIAKSHFGTTPQSSTWNINIDFNKDGVINTVDLGFIIKNFGKSGESGVWISPPPTQATSSGGLWMWIPEI